MHSIEVFLFPVMRQRPKGNTDVLEKMLRLRRNLNKMDELRSEASALF